MNQAMTYDQLYNNMVKKLLWWEMELMMHQLLLGQM